VRLDENPSDAPPGELFWAAGRVMRVFDGEPSVIEIQLNGLRCKQPYRVQLDADRQWLAREGQCFEAQVNLECESPADLCIFNVQPLGSPTRTPDEIWDDLQAIALPRGNDGGQDS